MSFSKTASLSGTFGVSSQTLVPTIVPQVTGVQIQTVLTEYLNLVSATTYLNPQEKAFVQSLNLPDQSDFVQNLASIINSILSDGIIVSHDLPKLVLLSSELVHVTQKKSLANVGVLNVLRFILTSLLHNNLIPIPVNQIDKAQLVLEDCFTLLNIVLPTPQAQNTCIQTIFPCWK